ncbi:aprataxin and PNK-like factor isoform X3 [Culex quinquefasciatus]|uniref:aprataxin and PNK-like factor isoform X3 n=1 Tax=Culex quinquefasciatus TaxID=7176 RepID=UPI0018E2E59C|nr:aprataxin and PNK-like factor isoform X3 [Culex quinquefasciatus]
MPSLYLFDCDRQVDIAVPNQPGSIVTIGRDSILQCNDARISRTHGTLKLDAVESGGGHSVQITSTHSNPIFIRTGVDGVLNILAKDLTATLQKGDKFALLPDQYWYEIRFGEVATGPEVPANGEVTSTGVTLRVRTMEEVNSGPIPDASVAVAGEKRKNSGEDSEADSSKRHRSEATEDGVVTSNQNPEEEAAAADALESPSFEATTPTVVKPDPDGEENEAAEGSSGAAGPKFPQPDAAPAVEVKKETADSTGPPVRPSCQFGIACYRHTTDHRAEFAHPHDVDYRRPAFPPAADDAPHCPFGAACYRRNPQHFREYQHPDSSEYAAAKYVPRIGQLPTTGDGDDSDQDDNGAARPQRNVRQPAKLGDYVIY